MLLSVYQYMKNSCPRCERLWKFPRIASGEMSRVRICFALGSMDVPNRLVETGDPEMGPSEFFHVRKCFAPRSSVDVPTGVGLTGPSDVLLMGGKVIAIT
jgi:hypothetical protein